MDGEEKREGEGSKDDRKVRRREREINQWHNIWQKMKMSECKKRGRDTEMRGAKNWVYGV
jgi:hypothetical protein